MTSPPFDGCAVAAAPVDAHRRRHTLLVSTAF
jgi:hypothetical protein